MATPVSERPVLLWLGKRERFSRVLSHFSPRRQARCEWRKRCNHLTGSPHDGSFYIKFGNSSGKRHGEVNDVCDDASIHTLHFEVALQMIELGKKLGTGFLYSY